MKEKNMEMIKTEVIAWLQDWFIRNGEGCNAIVGISGGKDSSVVAALCVEALGRERVIGVLMPNGEQSDIDMSRKLMQHLGINGMVVNIGETVKSLQNGISCPTNESFQNWNMNELSIQTNTNLPARIRMTTLYAISQSCNGRVIGTGNYSENFIGYFTRYGDGATDCEPIGKLTVTEVRQLGLLLGLPEELVYKVPQDGLQEKTDEENLGFSYEVLDEYLSTGNVLDVDAINKAKAMHQKNNFKMLPMEMYAP